MRNQIYQNVLKPMLAKAGPRRRGPSRISPVSVGTSARNYKVAIRKPPAGGRVIKPRRR